MTGKEYRLHERAVHDSSAGSNKQSPAACANCTTTPSGNAFLLISFLIINSTVGYDIEAFL